MLQMNKKKGKKKELKDRIIFCVLEKLETKRLGEREIDVVMYIHNCSIRSQCLTV